MPPKDTGISIKDPEVLLSKSFENEPAPINL